MASPQVPEGSTQSAYVPLEATDTSQPAAKKVPASSDQLEHYLKNGNKITPANKALIERFLKGEGEPRSPTLLLLSKMRHCDTPSPPSLNTITHLPQHYHTRAHHSRCKGGI